LCIAGIVCFYSLYGAILNGFDLGSTLYAIRLICLVVCGVQIGEIFFNKFGDSIQDFYAALSRYYTVQALFGFLIYIAFRDAQLFWVFLQQLGITYGGDPHIGRFVSIYFDPNFYAVIGLIPFISMVRLIYLKPTNKNFLCLGILVFSILLTWSRSGLATFFMLLTYMLYKRLSQSGVLLFKRKAFGFFVLLFVCVFVVCLFRFYDVSFFFSRLAGVKTDGSALSRWNSFKMGLEVLCDYPLLGVGCNYLRKHIYTEFSSVDSSVLTTFANFGVIFSVAFVCVFAFYLYRFRLLCEIVGQKSKELDVAGGLYSFYLIVVVVFASLFNNILYFQFWLIPMVAVFTYFTLCVNKICVMNR
jgi:hypothetical protein